MKNGYINDVNMYGQIPGPGLPLTVTLPLVAPHVDNMFHHFHVKSVIFSFYHNKMKYI